MTAFNMNQPPNRLPHVWTARISKTARPVLELIVELAQHLEHLESKLPFAQDVGDMARCDDETHVYLEADLHGLCELSELDINIHNGRVYIRVAK